MTTILYLTFFLSLISLFIAAYYAHKEIMKDSNGEAEEITSNTETTVRVEELAELIKNELRELIRQEIKKELSNPEMNLESP